MAGTSTAARRAWRGRVQAVEAQQTTITPSQQQILQSAPQASPAPMGRLGRAYAPTPLYGSSAAGNSAVEQDARGGPSTRPGAGLGRGIANASPYPQREIFTAPSQLLRQARTPAYQHGRLIARDRRVTGRRGTVMLSGEPDTKPGFPDPDADGPARPGYEQINRTISFQIGTDSTAYLDNSVTKPTTTAGAKGPFALGTRGDPQTTIYGGTPGLAAFRPYGYRGFPQTSAAPAPRLVALAGGPLRRGTLIQEGAPGDGPQKFPSGPAWGLHTPTVPAPVTFQPVQRARFSQVQPPRLNRPLNNKSAGQSFSQAVVGQDGRVAVVIPRLRPGRQPGLMGWRGTGA